MTLTPTLSPLFLLFFPPSYKPKVQGILENSGQFFKPKRRLLFSPRYLSKNPSPIPYQTKIHLVKVPSSLLFKTH